jgi:membrane protease YdiL (CAAX protease family)
VLVPTHLLAHPWWDSITSSIALAAATVGPLLLVAYMLHASGENLGAIGLRDRRVFSNLCRAIGVVLLIFVAAIATTGLLKSIGVPTISSAYDGRSIRWAYLLPGIVGAARSGLLEEIIVVGYLLHRLSQLGWDDEHALWASVAVRASYHLYGGLTLVAFTVVFGVIMVQVYKRTGRLWVLILAHFVWDAALFTLNIATH